MEKERYSTDLQRLLFAGNMLEGKNSLNHYSVQNKSTLNLVLLSRSSFQIFVKSLSGTTLVLGVRSSDTIENVKAKLRGLDEIAPYLNFKGIDLEDSCTLADYNIQRESTITVVLLFKIFVKTLGKTFPLGVDGKDTIEVVKNKIQVKQGIPPHLQSLIFEGKFLQEGHTLEFYNIQIESVLHLTIRRMQIFVSTMAGSVISVYVDRSNTIQFVKESIELKASFPVQQQRLIFDGNHLEDDRTLADYNIQMDSPLLLMLSPKGDFQIFVKTLSGKSITLYVNESDTVDNVKAKLQEVEGVPPFYQRLIFSGIILEGTRSLRSYHIGMKSTIQLEFRPCDR
mmetsp:Transcript_6246/g.10836  ORF Transcript_6246/g.10836 Transcript_6246/m.10836 type:complete len:340 (-) Transcript_6246:24-1043(-)